METLYGLSVSLLCLLSAIGGAGTCRQVETIMAYVPLSEKIDRFWMDEANRKSDSWAEHREINMVMLVTSLAPR